jgi:hypothetical protein
MSRFRYEVSGTYRCEVVESKAREPICLTKSPKAAEMIADALNFDFTETLTDNRDLRERVAELDRLRLEREVEYELLRKQRDEFESRAKEAKRRLANFEIKMTCGHPLAAAQDGVDPPHCTICAVTKERDRLNDHITWMARDQAENPTLLELERLNGKERLADVTGERDRLRDKLRRVTGERDRLRDKLRRVHLALSQIPDLGVAVSGIGFSPESLDNRCPSTYDALYPGEYTIGGHSPRLPNPLRCGLVEGHPGRHRDKTTDWG